MVKKSSVPKKIKTESVEKTVEERIEALTAEIPETETKPAQVMQVVEVTEEIPEETQAPVESMTLEEKISEMKEEEPTMKEEQTPAEEQTEHAREEKQKEVVSEFFATKKEPKTFGYPDISVHKKSSFPSIILWALSILLIVAGIGAVIIGINKGGMKSISFAKPTPTVTPTIAPTASPTPQADRSKLKVEILNGSGKAGVASTMKTVLEGKGYVVAGTGNAQNYDYAKTEIQVKAEQSVYLPVLQADLSGSYSIGSASSTLKSSLPYDAVVIVGKE